MNDGTNDVSRLVTYSRRNLLLVNRKVSIYNNIVIQPEDMESVNYEIRYFKKSNYNVEPYSYLEKYK